MNNIWIIIKEQLQHLRIIFHIAKYESKASYQGHHLGVAWEILNPILQTSVLYLIFGLGLRDRSDVDGVPFLPFLVVGQAAWLFMNNCVQQGSKSVKGKLNLISKTKFPISILPTIFMVGKLKAFFVKLSIGIITAFFSGIFPSFQWFQFIYYFIAMILFLLCIGLFTSTVNILFSDFQFILNTLMRLIFFTSGIMIPLDEMGSIGEMLRLNPFHYVISGFRNVFLYQVNFWERGYHALFFWTFTFFIGLIGAHLHLKFRAKFSDFI